MIFIMSPVMMGLQATGSKRKRAEPGARPQPAKVGRREETLCDVVAGSAPGLDDWRLESTSSVLASALLGDPAARHDEEDEEEEEEDDDDDEDLGPARSSYQCVRYGVDCYPGAYGSGEDHGAYAQYHPPSPHQYLPSRTAYWGPQGAMDGASGSEYYDRDAGSQQTIRCDENGKSYLDLGSSSARYVPGGGAASAASAASVASVASGGGPAKCCDGSRTNWCDRGPASACYRQHRLAVLNISMCKLGRYRQFPDPSLHRSVLICNTLRYIEREMEQEGLFFNGGAGAGGGAQAPAPVEPAPAYPPTFPEVPAAETPYRGMDVPPPYEQNLREFSSGRATPFPHGGYETDSGLGEDESGRGINWGSVLSLSSQSDLDPLNNNELYASSPPGDSPCLLPDVDLGQELDDFLPGWKLAPLSADDVLRSVPGRQDGELDGLMRVLVGT
ncbi:uncharacterized protein LOC134536156 isoform X2 [Bacillus rossius redtenbacheri]|uniref:uncharacterized protein LOC134536156 isoform X2 n=1 Tax=Bacillus rossius redtenbacheri TaxID=93214 RepID=UPI002FDD7EB3